MDNNNKLFVFDRKEIILIFVFVIVIAATAFTIGVRIGKRISLKNDGFTAQDQMALELKSSQEEDVEDLLLEEDIKLTPDQLEKISLESVDRNLEAAKQNNGPSAKVTTDPKIEDSDIPGAVGVDAEMEEPDEKTKALAVSQEGSNDGYSGKFTIQVGSFDNIADAKEFAETFLLRGYDVIIRQAELKELGTYFRVSLGVFATYKEANEFIEKENSLFSDQDKIIKRFE